MKNSIAKKLATRVEWSNQNISSVLISANSASQTLLRRNLSLEDFLDVAIESHSFAVPLLLKRLKLSHQISETMYDTYIQKIIENESLKTHETNKNTHFARLIATAILFENPSWALEIIQHYKTYELTRDDTLLFAKNVYRFLSHDSQVTNHMACFLYLVYDFFEEHYMENIAYSLGVEMPLQNEMPFYLKKLFDKLLVEGKFRFIYLISKIFLNIRLQLLELSVNDLMDFVVKAQNNNMFRGLLFSRNMISQEYETELEGLCAWYTLMVEKAPINPNWESLKDWFKLYFILEKITCDTNDASTYIEEIKDIPTQNILLEKLAVVEQLTFESLYFSNDKLLVTFIEKLGENNMFSLNNEAVFVPNALDGREILKHFLNVGYSTQEIIAIYMNSPLRLTVGIYQLFYVLFSDTTDQAIHHGKIKLRRYFYPYTFKAKVIRQNDVVYCKIHNFKSVPLRLNGYRYFSHKDFIDAYIDEHEEVTVGLESLNIINFSADLNMLFNEEDKQKMQKMAEENINQLFTILKDIRLSGELSRDTLHQLTHISFSREFDAKEKEAFSKNFYAALVKLATQSQPTRPLIDTINAMKKGQLNPQRYHHDSKYRQDSFITDELFTFYNRGWDQLKYSGISFEELFYIYINTKMKYVVPFSNIVLYYYPNEEETIDLTFLNPVAYTYQFAGFIKEQDNNVVNIVPFEFKPKKKTGFDHYIYQTSQTYQQGTNCFFTIKAYQPKTNTFILNQVNTVIDRRIINNETRFIEALDYISVDRTSKQFHQEYLDVKPLKLSDENMVKVISLVITGVEKRNADSQEIIKYFKRFESNNPFKFSLEKIKTVEDYGLKANAFNLKKRSETILDELFKKNDLKSILSIYFNSPLKFYIPLNDVIEKSYQQTQELETFKVWMKDYPIVVEGNHTINMLVDTSIHTHQKINYFEKYDFETSCLLVE